MLQEYSRQNNIIELEQKVSIIHLDIRGRKCYKYKKKYKHMIYFLKKAILFFLISY